MGQFGVLGRIMGFARITTLGYVLEEIDQYRHCIFPFKSSGYENAPSPANDY